MESISERISFLNNMASSALSLANNFINYLNVQYSVNTSELPAGNAILVDPTYKTPKLPDEPDYPSPLSEPFPVMPSSGQFTDIPDSPLIFQDDEDFDFNEDKVLWLKNETRNAIRKLFNETGYEAVEIDMWEKGIERDTQVLYDAEDQAVSSFSAKGFTLPNDIIDKELQEINSAFDDARLKRNSDIFLQQMDIAQKNVQTGINAGLNGEGIFIGYASRIAGRSLEAAKAVAGIGLEIFRVKTIGYNAELRSRRMAMEGAVEIESALLNAYNEKSDAVRQHLDAYVTNLTTLWDGYKRSISAYKSEISAGKAKADVTMSWRKSKYRENLAKIKSQLEVDILNMNAWIEIQRINMHRQTSKVMYYVHFLSATLGALQVLVQEANEYEETVLI